MRSEFVSGASVAISIDFNCKVPADAQLFGLVTIPLSRWNDFSGALDLVALAAAAINGTQRGSSARFPVSFHSAVYDQRLRRRRTLLEANDDGGGGGGGGGIASEPVRASQKSIQRIFESLAKFLKSTSDKFDLWQSIVSQWDNSVAMFNRVRSETSLPCLSIL